MQSIVIYGIISFILSIFLNHFVMLSDRRSGEDFSFKEYIQSFKKLSINYEYFLIFLIIFLIIAKKVSIYNILVYPSLIFGLILGFILDIKYMIIPNTSSLLVIFSEIMNLIFNFSKENIVESLLGLVIGYGSLFLINLIFYTLTKTDGFGMGDMKLLGSIGFFVGIKKIIVIFLLSIFISSIVGLVYLAYRYFKKNSKEKIINLYLPFGPFIIVSSLILFSIPESIYDNLIYIIVNKMI